MIKIDKFEIRGYDDKLEIDGKDITKIGKSKITKRHTSKILDLDYVDIYIDKENRKVYVKDYSDLADKINSERIYKMTYTAKSDENINRIIEAVERYKDTELFVTENEMPLELVEQMEEIYKDRKQNQKDIVIDSGKNEEYYQEYLKMFYSDDK